MAMAASKTPDSPPPSSSIDDGENNILPFFVLRKALPQKGDGKTKRKINLSTSPKSTLKYGDLENFLEDEENTKSQECDEAAAFRRLKSGCGRRVNEKAAALMECMIKSYLRPIECTPLHEIVCFKQVKMLKSGLIGDPRRTIQIDLLKSHNYLHYNCGSEGGNSPLRSMHDTAILYTLAQEHGDLINLHDWFQSFKSIILLPSPSKKRKLNPASAKERKQVSEHEDTSEASLQARFCRAVTELQITGLLRMPTKRRPDYVQRVAFGL
ncbi:hypothetical protein Syun_016018 [Stephania yunnanensis]|uniref:Origin recognition complex subunit 3 winged helix C-terminal domain-containing protein n=1 Tax=Stephania yunnanensis TaxID=152371 RepID=A0AAP0J453_9MAGN